MASDNSPTRNRAILGVAVGTVGLLVGIKFALDSYFVQMAETTAHEKLVSPEQLIAHREAEKKALAGGPMPIDQALAEVGRRGRDGLSGGGVDLSPRQSDDTGALIGWSKMPKAVPQKAVDAPAPTPSAPAPDSTLPVPAPTATGSAPAPHGSAPAPGTAPTAAPTTAPTAPHH